VVLLATNGVPLLAVVSLSGGAVAAGGQLMWSHAVVMMLTGVAFEAVLLSKPIRQYIGSRGPRVGSAVRSR
jgi:prepilin signal peptidase PulO-like enzyme (type II secretory pathway)